MPEKNAQFSWDNFGAKGLLTASPPVDEPSEFLAECMNMMWNTDDTLSVRPPFRRKSDFSLANPGTAVYYRSTTPTDYGIYAANGNFYVTTNPTQGQPTLITNSATSWTNTSNDWDYAQSGSYLYCFQRGVIPKRINATASAVTDVPSGGGPPNAHIVHAGYGRLWAADTAAGSAYTLYWSDLNLPEIWNSGGSGSLDMRTVWGGYDEITAIDSFDGYLVVFSKYNIVLFQNPYLATFAASGSATAGTTMSVKQVIKGLGTFCRDTVVNIGNDLIFLSGASNVARLSRAIVQSNPAISSISNNVQKLLVAQAGLNRGSGLNGAKAVYWESYNMYMLFLPYQVTSTRARMLLFDLGVVTDDAGNVRVTEWSLVPSAVNATPSAVRGFLCFPDTPSGLGNLVSSGYGKEYLSWVDQNGFVWCLLDGSVSPVVAELGTNQFVVRTHFMSLLRNYLVILKRLSMHVITGRTSQDQLSVQVFGDYVTNTPIYTGATTDPYSPVPLNYYSLPLGGTSSVFSLKMIFGPNYTVNHIQRVSVQFSKGRLSNGT